MTDYLAYATTATGAGMSPYPPVDERPALLTPDEYIALLVERAREADEQSRAERTAAGLPPAPAWIRHLPEWMVRDGDEDLVDMAAVAAWTARHEEQPKRGLALRHIARTNPRREAEYQATLNDRADMWAGRPQDQRPEDRA